MSKGSGTSNGFGSGGGGGNFWQNFGIPTVGNIVSNILPQIGQGKRQKKARKGIIKNANNFYGLASDIFNPYLEQAQGHNNLFNSYNDQLGGIYNSLNGLIGGGSPSYGSPSYGNIAYANNQNPVANQLTQANQLIPGTGLGLPSTDIIMSGITNSNYELTPGAGTTGQTLEIGNPNSAAGANVLNIVNSTGLATGEGVYNNNGGLNINAIGDEYNNIAGQLAGLTGRYDAIGNNLSGISNQYGDIFNQYGDLSSQASGLGGALTDLYNQTGGIANDFANLSDQATGIDSLLSGLYGDVGGVAAKFGDLAAQTGNLTGEYTDQQGRYNKLIDETSQSQSNIRGFSNQIGQQANKVKNLQGTTFLNTAEGQAYLNEANDIAKQQRGQLQNTANLLGLSDEAVIAGLGNVNQNSGNTFRTLAVGENARQQGLRGEYAGLINQQAGLENQYSGLTGQKGNFVNAISGLTGAKAGLLGQQGNLYNAQLGAYGQQAGIAGQRANVLGLQGNLKNSQLGAIGQQAGLNAQQANLLGMQGDFAGRQADILASQRGLELDQANLVGANQGVLNDLLGVQRDRQGLIDQQMNIYGMQQGLLGQQGLNTQNQIGNIMNMGQIDLNNWNNAFNQGAALYGNTQAQTQAMQQNLGNGFNNALNLYYLTSMYNNGGATYNNPQYSSTFN